MRRFLTFATLGLTAFASANAVMGYALEQYDPRAWLVYVIATVIFEAWAIGKRLGFGWAASLGISIAANLVTACCCANLCGVGLHGAFVGSQINPNPIMNMAAMFFVFGLLSGSIESVVWRICDRRNEDRGRDFRVWLDSTAAHLAWVPLGMAIMLVPARPYPMLEAYTLYARRFYLMQLRSPLETKIVELGRVPDYHDIPKFFREITPADEPSSSDAWAVAYRPEFSRLSTGQPKGDLLWEWNPAATGLKIESDRLPNEIWLLRLIRKDDRYGFGLILREGNVSYTGSLADLGYGTPIRAR